MSAQHVCDVSDIPEVGALRCTAVKVDGSEIEIAVVRTESGDLHAVSDVCSHGQVSLSEGDVIDTTIECWLHGSTFDLETGAGIVLPPTEHLEVYPLGVMAARVTVAIDGDENGRIARPTILSRTRECYINVLPGNPGPARQRRYRYRKERNSARRQPDYQHQ